MAAGTRIDRWLWAVRVFKTRAAANNACSQGAVRIDGTVAKPARRVGVGEVVEVRRKGETSTYKVLNVIEKRVGAAIAADCYEDLTPAKPKPSELTHFDAPIAVRDRGQGRPTKAERRAIERLRGRR